MSSRRPTLDELRRRVLDVPPAAWTTPSALAEALELDRGEGYLRLALVLERLANDGELELRRPGSRRREFRRSRR